MESEMTTPSFVNDQWDSVAMRDYRELAHITYCTKVRRGDNIGGGGPRVHCQGVIKCCGGKPVRDAKSYINIWSDKFQTQPCQNGAVNYRSVN
jgi:hypothetical protein